MKILLSLAAVLVFFAVVFCQNESSIKSNGKPDVPTDAELSGLKSKVKKVVTEEAELKKKSGRFIESARKPEQTLEFDESGYLTQRIEYGIGEKNTYQFVDGDKTVKFSLFDSPYQTTEVITAVAPDDGKPKKPWDPRYDHRYVYKFDEKGRVTEEITFMGNGEYWQREVYHYNERGLRIKTEYFGNQNKPDWAEIYSVDENGVVLEMTSDSFGEEKTTTVYSDYKSDSKGNWTQRTESDVVIKKGKRIVTPTKKVYRTITYYRN